MHHHNGGVHLLRVSCRHCYRQPHVIAPVLWYRYGPLRWSKLLVTRWVSCDFPAVHQVRMPSWSAALATAALSPVAPAPSASSHPLWPVTAAVLLHGAAVGIGVGFGVGIGVTAATAAVTFATAARADVGVAVAVTSSIAVAVE